MQNPRLSNVLLISIDEEVVRTVSRVIGEMENAKLEIVETATRMKTHLAVVEYDLVLADTAVPDIITFMMKVLQAQQLQRPLIILYDHGDQEAAARALAGGAYDALSKPIDPVFFRAALRRALHHSRSSSHLGDEQNILDPQSTGKMIAVPPWPSSRTS
jgi:DNA-binding NtrC family response regulator